jgi:VIT1/CCC1 family predicted Fe2+/Mn2+ transporter
MSALTFLLAAAEGGEKASETPFVVAGVVLAAFAVLVAVIGMRREASEGFARLTMGLGAVLVVVTMAAMISIG